MLRTKAIIKRLISLRASRAVSPRQIRKFVADPDFPYLISFPRTGSHWLRMLMELYFEKPTLARSFYFHNAKTFLCMHDHDDDLQLYRKKFIYLYRNPVDTVYSQISYHQENTKDMNAITKWSDHYGRHLNKYLLQDNFSEKKTLLTYDRLKSDLTKEFSKVTDFFDTPFDANRLTSVTRQVDKKTLKTKTRHDPQVVTVSNEYEAARKIFRENFTDRIYQTLYQSYPALNDWI